MIETSRVQREAITSLHEACQSIKNEAASYCGSAWTQVRTNIISGVLEGQDIIDQAKEVGARLTEKDAEALVKRVKEQQPASWKAKMGAKILSYRQKFGKSGVSDKFKQAFQKHTQISR